MKETGVKELEGVKTILTKYEKRELRNSNIYLENMFFMSLCPPKTK